jgi:hypothetical protein
MGVRLISLPWLFACLICVMACAAPWQGQDTDRSALSSSGATPIAVAVTELQCAETPRHTGGRFPSSTWMQAEPASSGVFAILFYGNQRLHAGGQNPDGTRPKILWLVDPKQGTELLRVNALRLGTTTHFESQVHQFAPGDVTPIEDFFQYGQGLIFPNQGCWRVDLRSGAASGSVTFWVEPPVNS